MSIVKKDGKEVKINVAAEAKRIRQIKEAAVLAHVNHMDSACESIEDIMSSSNHADVEFEIESIRAALKSISEKVYVS